MRVVLFFLVLAASLAVLQATHPPPDETDDICETGPYYWRRECRRCYDDEDCTDCINTVYDETRSLWQARACRRCRHADFPDMCYKCVYELKPSTFGHHWHWGRGLLYRARQCRSCTTDRDEDLAEACVECVTKARPRAVRKCKKCDDEDCTNCLIEAKTCFQIRQCGRDPPPPPPTTPPPTTPPPTTPPPTTPPPTTPPPTTPPPTTPPPTTPPPTTPPPTTEPPLVGCPRNILRILFPDTGECLAASAALCPGASCECEEVLPRGARIIFDPITCSCLDCPGNVFP